MNWKMKDFFQSLNVEGKAKKETVFTEIKFPKSHERILIQFQRKVKIFFEKIQEIFGPLISLYRYIGLWIGVLKLQFERKKLKIIRKITLIAPYTQKRKTAA